MAAWLDGEAVLDPGEDGVVAVDAQGRITLANAAACLVLRRSQEELLGRSLSEVPVVDARGRPVSPEAHPVSTVLRDGRDIAGVVVGLGQGRQRRWYSVASQPVRDLRTQAVVGAVATYSGVKVTDLQRGELERRAYADPLTGLANRTLLHDRLTQALARVRRRGGGAALLLVDVDHFKSINDRLGHQAGDAVLVELAERLSGLARDEDTVARMGGEEFAVLLEQVGDPEEAAAVARRIRAELARPYDMTELGSVVLVTVSVGVAVTDEPTLDAQQLYGNADIALYRAKEQGRDRYVVFDEGLRAWAAARSSWRLRLGEAFRAGRLEVRRREIRDLSTGEPRGAQVIAVLPGGDGWPETELSPGVVGDAALAGDLDAWLVREALRLPITGPVLVQLSARTLMHPELPGRLAKTVEDAGRDPAALVVCGGERELQEQTAGARSAMVALRERGLRLGLIDVRGDRLPMRMLAEPRFERVCIGEPLLREAGTDPLARATVRAITGLYAELGTPVGAEGLDDPELVELARSLGCEQGSGAALR